MLVSSVLTQENGNTGTKELLPRLQNEVSSDVFLFILTFNGKGERGFGKNGRGFKPNHDTTIVGIIICHSNPYQFVLGHRLGILISTIVAHCHFCFF